MTGIAVGDKIRLMWPKAHPTMCVVGHVVKIDQTDDGMDVAVRFSDDKDPVSVLVGCAKVSYASKAAECGYWMRYPKRSES